MVRAATEERYDLFTAADLFIYVGNLETLFSAVRRAGRVEAWFAFSIELTDGADFKLNETGRYAHSRSYIEFLSRKFGFTVAISQEETIRKQSGLPVVGELFVLRSATGVDV